MRSIRCTRHNTINLISVSKSKQGSIQDRQGKLYTVLIDDENETYPIFRIMHKQAGIGYANCRIYGKTLELSDFCIKDKALHPSYFSFLPRKWRERNYRHRGIGSAFLRYLVSFAKERGIEQIQGYIKRADFSHRPWLPKWYEGRGFEIRKEPAKSGRIATILMQITK